jgi:SAM-dependent methyltransferase
MKVEKCRMCDSVNLAKWLDLGHHPHSDQFKLTRDIEEKTYPLGVLVCEDCGLNQLTFVVPKEDLYINDYLYESSMTKTADLHWEELADTVIKNIHIPEKGMVVDIGSNDGTLLTKFQARGFNVLGIDPTPEVTEIARKRGVPTITDFFGEKAIEGKKADLVVGTNVFAHIHDLNDLILNVKKLLNEDGAFVFESPYFGDFLKGLEYDTVYHQHLSYLSLKPVVKFLEKFEMEVFNVDRTDIHGGSFRVYICNKGKYDIQASVKKTLDEETWTMQDLNKFADDVKQNREDIFDLVYKLYKEGKKISVVSTPAKGQTLLNYTGIGRFIEFATDKSKLKQGRFTPGTFIKIYPDSELIESQPDYALLLAWNFAPEIIKNNSNFKGKWIIPIPKVKII